MDDTIQTKERVEQNDPSGSILQSTKPDLMCGDAHQISIFQPTVIIDSHMHIQSGRCSTLQFVRNQGPLAPIQEGFQFSRTVIEGAGTATGGLLTLFEWLLVKPVEKIVNIFSDSPPKNSQDKYFERNALLELLDMQTNSTDVVADLFINERDNVFDNYFNKAENCPLYVHAPHLVFSSVVMTMDMEYAHIDGYFGLRIYNPLYDKDKPIDPTDPARYWTPSHGKWEKFPLLGGLIDKTFYTKLRDKTVYQKVGVSGKVEVIDRSEGYNVYKKNAKNDGHIIGCCWNPQIDNSTLVSIEALPVLMSKAEGKKYENWDRQLKLTEEAILKYPLKLLPMFHYDPRRWQLKGKGANADLITKVMGENALYLGFKMYTAQGYRPWDVRRLPTMKEFYGKCCLNGIPILNHCTPGGAKTQEADEYYNLEHPFDDSNEETKEREGCSATDYFSKYFVSPEAWKKVLDSGVELEEEQYCLPLNNLRLCLAHFGGPKALDWSQQIIDMIMHKDKYVPNLFAYPNLYTDISSSFASGNFRDYFKELFTNKLSELEKKRMRSRILFGTDWFLIFGYSLFNKQMLWDYITTTKEWLDSFDTSLWPYFTQYNPYRFYRLDTQVPRIKDCIIKKLKNKAVLEGHENPDEADFEPMINDAAWVQKANQPQFDLEETKCVT